jgi:TatD DNase family protein
VELFDSHAHLTDERFAEDLDAVLARAAAAGVTRILTLGADVASSRAAVALANTYPQVYAAVGIHPEAVGEASAGDVEIIRDLAAQPRVVAIGEIGLDYHWDKTTAERQQEFFERQLDLAADLDLPVAIHDREAHDRILETLRGRKRGLRGVLHAFSGDAAMARTAIALGFLISFGGPVTFRNERVAPGVVREMPLEKILIETDSPYLAPHPLRGRRNEPANVARVAERVAELQQVSLEQVSAQTGANGRRLFSV